MSETYFSHIIIYQHWFTGWKEAFSVIIAGDEVKAGKPSPEMYDS